MPPLKYKMGGLENSPGPSFEIFILAGGNSSRMGRDKSRLKFGSRTLLSHIRAIAKSTGLTVRTVRRDSIPHCGPLSGIYTALTKTSADAVVFLACDMPLISPGLLRKILKRFAGSKRPLFTKTESAGFPFILPKSALKLVGAQISHEEFSMRSLAKKLKAQSFCPNLSEVPQLLNVNTPSDWEKVKKQGGRLIG